MKDPILLLTSVSFIAPVTYAAYNDMWDIYSSLLCVLLTSVAFHSSKEPILRPMRNLIDHNSTTKWWN